MKTWNDLVLLSLYQIQGSKVFKNEHNFRFIVIFGDILFLDADDDDSLAVACKEVWQYSSFTETNETFTFGLK